MSADAEYAAAYYVRVRGRAGGDLNAVRSHVALLRESGMSLPRISELSGAAYLVVRNIARHGSCRVTRSVADRLLALEPGDVGDGTMVDRSRADTPLARLVARGWTPQSIGAAFGYADGVAFRVQRDRVRMGTVRRLAALLDVDPPGSTLAAATRAEVEAEAQRDVWQRKQEEHRRGQGMEPRYQDPDMAEPWRTDAACHRPGSPLTPVFFSGDPVDIARAKQVCRTCPVQVECLTWALSLPEREDFGTAGGLSEEERRTERNRRRRRG